MKNFEKNAYIYFYLKIIVIFGALNWGLIALNKKYNLIELFSKLLVSSPYSEYIEKSIYIIIFISTVYIMFQRKTYLPFLDVAVVPLVKLLPQSKQKNFELEIKIDVGEGEKVIYWASNKKEKNIVGKEEISDWEKAYGDYENSGVSLVEKDGTAKLYVKCPQKYYVKYGKIIPKHVHYRIVSKGKIGEVKTINVEC